MKQSHLVRDSQSSEVVSIYFKLQLYVEVLKELHECNAIKLKLNNISYRIIGTHRPHSGSVDDFVAELVNLFSNVRDFAHQNVILLGD